MNRSASRPLRIAVDHERCVGNATCLATAPSTFAHDANRQSVVVDRDGDPEAAILEAARLCPTGAITVEVAETGQRLFPPEA